MAGMPDLTARQMQVLRLYDQNYGRHDIATELRISSETVRTITERIKTALDVPVGDDIGQMLRIARERGVLTGVSRYNPERDLRGRQR